MLREKMLWGGGGEIVSIVADVNRWSPDAHAERPEPIPYRPETRQHIDRGNRNELFELARCRHRAWRRAPAGKEARGPRERISETSQTLARANSDCQPNESSVNSARHPRLQSQAKEGRRAP